MHPIDIVSLLQHSIYGNYWRSLNTEKIDPELSLPTMRSDMEQQLNLIAMGKAPQRDVLQYFLDMFERKFAYFVKNVSCIGVILEWLTHYE